MLETLHAIPTHAVTETMGRRGERRGERPSTFDCAEVDSVKRIRVRNRKMRGRRGRGGKGGGGIDFTQSDIVRGG